MGAHALAPPSASVPAPPPSGPFALTSASASSSSLRVRSQQQQQQQQQLQQQPQRQPHTQVAHQEALAPTFQQRPQQQQQQQQQQPSRALVAQNTYSALQHQQHQHPQQQHQLQRPHLPHSHVSRFIPDTAATPAGQAPQTNVQPYAQLPPPPDSYASFDAHGAASTHMKSCTNPAYPYPDNLVYPAIHLYSVDNGFFPKQISLGPYSTSDPPHRVRIGRQTNNKTVPLPTNGYFDSKVLSRMHAEIWRDQDQVWIKDLKSSNGTFLNGERLSSDGQDADAFELHNDDLVEFGIDIAGEDGTTIMHHRVSCKVQLILTEEDALLARADFLRMSNGNIGRLSGGGPSHPDHVTTGGATVSTSGQAPGSSSQGQSSYAHRGLTGHDGSGVPSVGGGDHPPMSFDYLFAHIQVELKNSREAAEAMELARQDLQDAHHLVRNGLDPPDPHAEPAYQHLVPPACPVASSSHQQVAQNSNTGISAKTSSAAADEQKKLQENLDRQLPLAQDVAALQCMLDALQSSLRDQSDRMRLLDTAVGQQQELASHLTALREALAADREEEEEGVEDAAPELDFDDGMSVVSTSTIRQDEAVQSQGTSPSNDAPKSVQKVSAFLAGQDQVYPSQTHEQPEQETYLPPEMEDSEDGQEEVAEIATSASGLAPPDLPPHLREAWPGGAIVDREDPEKAASQKGGPKGLRGDSNDFEARIATLEQRLTQVVTAVTTRSSAPPKDHLWNGTYAYANGSSSPSSRDADLHEGSSLEVQGKDMEQVRPLAPEASEEADWPFHTQNLSTRLDRLEHIQAEVFFKRKEWERTQETRWLTWSAQCEQMLTQLSQLSQLSRIYQLSPGPNVNRIPQPTEDSTEGSEATPLSPATTQNSFSAGKDSIAPCHDHSTEGTSTGTTSPILGPTTAVSSKPFPHPDISRPAECESGHARTKSIMWGTQGAMGVAAAAAGAMAWYIMRGQKA